MSTSWAALSVFVLREDLDPSHADIERIPKDVFVDPKVIYICRHFQICPPRSNVSTST